MEEYLRSANFLSSRFKFGKGITCVAGFSSKWTGAVTKDNYQSTHIRFETINFSYNYAMANFNLAMSEIKDTNKAQDILKRFRAAAWGMSETMKYTTTMRTLMKLPDEFADEVLGYLHAMITGMMYLCMFRAFEKTPAFASDDMKMASLLKEVHGYFQACKHIFESSKLVRKHYQKFHNDVLWNFYKYSYLAIHHACKGLLARHEAEVTRGHLGTAISYMNNIGNMMELIKIDKYLSKDDKKQLEEMHKKDGWAQIKKDSIEKNNKVYNFPVPPCGEVRVIEEWDKKLPELSPNNIYVPPQGFEHFQHFMSEELEKIDSNLKLFLQNKRQFVQKLYYDVNQKKEQVYREKNVDFIINCKSMSANKLDDTFFTDVQMIRDQNGGLKGYEELKQNVGNERNDLQSIIAQIDSKIMATKKEDADFLGAMRKEGGGATLAEVVNFESSNPDLIQNILAIHANASHYNEMGQQAIPEYEKQKTWLVKLCDANQDWNAYAKNQTGDAYIKEHMADIEMVIKVEGIITMISSATKKEYDELLDVLDKFEIYTYVSKVAMREMREEQVYEELDNRTKDKFDRFDEHCRKCLSGFDKVSEKAQILNEIQKYANESDLNQVLQAVKFYKDVYPKFTDLLVGYHKLNMEGSKARDLLDDYLVAKVIERQNTLDDVKRRKSEMDSETLAKRLHEEEMMKAAQQKGKQSKQQASQPKQQAPAPSNFGMGGNIPAYNSFGQQAQPNYGMQQTQGYPQPPQQQNQYSGGWGRQQPPIPFHQGQPIQHNQGQQGGYANPYMNPHYPPWYDSKNPSKGPW